MPSRAKVLGVVAAALMMVLGVTVTASATAGPVATAASTGPHLTLLFSRTALTGATDCREDDAGVVRLDTVVAPTLAAMGIRPTGSLETSATLASTSFCSHYRTSLFASWDQAQQLATTYGWSFVSHTATYPHTQASWAALTPTQLYAETCGSAQVISAHGLPGAIGLLAWPNDYVYPGALPDVTSCFDFNRRYGPGITDKATAVQPPYAQSTTAFTGGPCQDKLAACYSSTFPYAVTRYRSPKRLLAKIATATPDQWVTLQAYLFVTGYEPGQWDCRGSSWADHWTDDTERYCWNDFLSVVSALPAGLSVTDPATVGADWGRNAPGLPPPAPLQITGFTPTSGPVGTAVAINGSGFTGTTKVKFHGVAASFNVVSDGQIVAGVPPSATSGQIRVVVGRQGVSSGTPFKVTQSADLLTRDSGDAARPSACSAAADVPIRSWTSPLLRRRVTVPDRSVAGTWTLDPRLRHEPMTPAIGAALMKTYVATIDVRQSLVHRRAYTDRASALVGVDGYGATPAPESCR